MTDQPTTKGATPFEYTSITIEHRPPLNVVPSADHLNQLGLEGWELVSVHWLQRVYEDIFLEIFYLKRPKP